MPLEIEPITSAPRSADHADPRPPNRLVPAITGPAASRPGALILVGTLFSPNGLVAAARVRSSTVRRLLEPTATTIALDGKWLPDAIKREGLDAEEEEEALREHGLSSVSEVRHAVLEPDTSTPAFSQRPSAGPVRASGIE